MIENLGNFHIAFNYMLVASIVVPTLACVFVSIRKFTTDTRFLLAIWIRYMFLSSLILIVGVLVAFMKPNLEQGNAPSIKDLPDAKFSDTLANLTAIVAGAFLVVMVVTLMVLCFESRKYARAMAEERNATYA